MERVVETGGAAPASLEVLFVERRNIYLLGDKLIAPVQALLQNRSGVLLKAFEKHAPKGFPVSGVPVHVLKD